MLQKSGFLLLGLPLLAACESSMRLPALGSPFGQQQTQAAPIAAAPAPRVQSTPLAPPVAQQDLPPPPGAQAAQPPRYESLPETEQTPGSGQTAPGAFGEPPKQARLEPPKQSAQTPKSAEDEPAAAPTRTSVTGNWTAQEASGGSCKVTLSSSPKLDLYNAGTTGCQSKELQRVTAWELRGDEVYLYESGGSVAARLRASPGRRFNGALAKTGAPVTLSK